MSATIRQPPPGYDSAVTQQKLMMRSQHPSSIRGIGHLFDSLSVGPDIVNPRLMNLSRQNPRRRLPAPSRLTPNLDAMSMQREEPQGQEQHVIASHPSFGPFGSNEADELPHIKANQTVLSNMSRAATPTCAPYMADVGRSFAAQTRQQVAALALLKDIMHNSSSVHQEPQVESSKDISHENDDAERRVMWQLRHQLGHVVPLSVDDGTSSTAAVSDVAESSTQTTSIPLLPTRHVANSCITSTSSGAQFDPNAVSAEAIKQSASLLGKKKASSSSSTDIIAQLTRELQGHRLEKVLSPKMNSDHSLDCDPVVLDEDELDKASRLESDNARLKMELAKTKSALSAAQYSSGMAAKKQGEMQARLDQIQSDYQAMVHELERRLHLEESARVKLNSVINRLSDENQDLTNRYESVVQLLSDSAAAIDIQQQSGEQYSNANVPSQLFAALTKSEMDRKQNLIRQLMTQNESLVEDRRRADAEITAQHETLQEQRSHIQLLEKTLAKERLHAGQLERDIPLTSLNSNGSGQCPSNTDSTADCVGAVLPDGTKTSGLSQQQTVAMLDMTSLDELRREFQTAEAQIVRLTYERGEWQRLTNEAIAEKQAKIEQLQFNQEQLLNSFNRTRSEWEKSDKRQQLEQVNLEMRITRLQNQVQEKNAIIEILASDSPQFNQTTNVAGKEQPMGLQQLQPAISRPNSAMPSLFAPSHKSTDTVAVEHEPCRDVAKDGLTLADQMRVIHEAKAVLTFQSDDMSDSTSAADQALLFNKQSFLSSSTLNPNHYANLPPGNETIGLSGEIETNCSANHNEAHDSALNYVNLASLAGKGDECSVYENVNDGSKRSNVLPLPVRRPLSRDVVESQSSGSDHRLDGNPASRPLFGNAERQQLPIDHRPSQSAPTSTVVDLSKVASNFRFISEASNSLTGRLNIGSLRHTSFNRSSRKYHGINQSGTKRHKIQPTAVSVDNQHEAVEVGSLSPSHEDRDRCTSVLSAADLVQTVAVSLPGGYFTSSDSCCDQEVLQVVGQEKSAPNNVISSVDGGESDVNLVEEPVSGNLDNSVASGHIQYWHI